MCFFLLPFVWFFSSADSGNRSRVLPGSGKEDGIARGVGQHCLHCFGKRKGTGRILETAGSPGDLKSHGALGLISREIDAIASLREIDIQQTAILEAKYAPAGQLLEIELICARASAGRRRRICDGSYITNGE